MRELSMHILDVLENALEAGATCIELTVDEDLSADQLTIVVRDNGRGMDAVSASRALDPFFTTRTSRHVGLGLPLFIAAAERCDGRLCLESAPGLGTTVTATFRHSHVDRAPLGNMTDTLMAFMLAGHRDPAYTCEAGGQGASLYYRHRHNERTFELDSSAIREALGEIPVSYPPVREWLQDFLAEGEAGLTADG